MEWSAKLWCKPLSDVDVRPLQDLMSSHGFGRAEVAAAEQLARQLFESEGPHRSLPGASDAAPSVGAGLRGGRAGAAGTLPDAATPALQMQVSLRSATGVPSVPSQQQQQQPNTLADAAAAEPANGPASMDTAPVEQPAGDAAGGQVSSMPPVQSAVLSASSAAQPDAKKSGAAARTLMPTASSAQRDVLLTFEMFERIWLG